MPSNWIWIILETIVGIVIYTGMILLLKAPIVDQAKELVRDKKRS